MDVTPLDPADAGRTVRVRFGAEQMVAGELTLEMTAKVYRVDRDVIWFDLDRRFVTVVPADIDRWVAVRGVRGERNKGSVAAQRVNTEPRPGRPLPPRDNTLRAKGGER